MGAVGWLQQSDRQQRMVDRTDVEQIVAGADLGDLRGAAERVARRLQEQPLDTLLLGLVRTDLPSTS